MLRKTLVLFFLLFSLPVLAAKAVRCTYQRPDDLVIAQWGGLWQKKKETGYFRVLVYRTGWEHSHDVIQTDVMYRDERRKRITLRHCTQVKDDSSTQRVVKSVSIREATLTSADVQIIYQAAPYTSAPKTFIYSVDTHGRLEKKG